MVKREKAKDNADVRRAYGFGHWCAEGKLEMDRDRLGYLFLAMAAGVFLLMMAYYVAHFYQLVNDDIAGEHLYSLKIWETGNPFSPEFANNRELLFSRAWWVFLAAYALVRDVALSTKIELVVATLMVACSVVFFFRKLKWSWPAVFLASAAFWGLMCREVRVFMIPSLGYPVFYAGMFLTLGAVADIAGGGKRRGLIAEQILMYVLAGYFGICGVRMLMYLYVPLEAVLVLDWISGKLNGRGMTDTQRRVFFHASLLLAVNLIGLAVNLFVIVPYMRNVSVHFSMVSYGSVWEAVRDTCRWFLQALGINFAGGSMLSPYALMAFCMIGLTGVFIWIGFYLRKKDFYSETERIMIELFLLSAAILAFFFVVSGELGFPARFVTVPMAMAFMVGMAYRYLRPHRDLRVLLAGLLLFVMAGAGLNAWVSYVSDLGNTSKPNALMQLAEYLEQTGRDRIAGPYWNISTVEFFSNCEIEGLTLNENDGMQPYDWITDRTDYVNDDKPITLVLTGKQKEDWEQSEKRSALLSMADGTDTEFGYYLYDYEQNPFAFNLLDYGVDARFNFLSLFGTEGTELRDGEIVLSRGETQFGPYCSMPAGTYDVTVFGENLQAGSFDVADNIAVENGGSFCEMEDLELHPDHVTYTLHLDDGAEHIEFRCTNGTDEEIAIREIAVEPRDLEPIWE